MHANDDLLALGRSCKMTRNSQLIAESMKRLLRRRYALKGDRFKSVVQAYSESRTACAAWWHRGGALLDAAMYAAVMNKLGVIIFSETNNGPVAHATGTYSVP